MPSKDHYLAVAKQIAAYLNAFSLAFKTYNVKQFDEMAVAVAGDGARVSTKTAAEEFGLVMLQRGLICFPTIQDAVEGDGYVRVYRAGSIAANILQAYLYPGQASDEDLARMLRTMARKKAASTATPASDG